MVSLFQVDILKSLKCLKMFEISFKFQMFEEIMFNVYANKKINFKL
jgi:hypothetical protein